MSNNITKQPVTFSVTNRCEGCGMCYAQFSEYFLELEDGKAESRISSYMLDKEQLDVIKKVCPFKAIEAKIEQPLTKQTFVTELENLKNFIVRYPKRESVKFDKREYNISIPVATGERRYEYPSEDAANRAAEREFNSKMYSQMDVIILRIITEYRVKYLKPFYTKEYNSFFADCNSKVSEILNKLECILKNNNLANDLPANFSEINIFPENDLYWKMLNKGQIMSDEMISTIKSKFHSRSYSDLGSYNYWDTDYTERPDGTNLRGNTKWKEKYCYKNMSKAFQELAKDLLNAIDFKDDVIEDRALEIIKVLVDEYNKLLVDIISEKIIYLEDKIQFLPSDSAMDSIQLKEYDNIVRAILNSDKEGIKVNGQVSIEREIFVTATKNAQFFFDGDVLKMKYISNNTLHNVVVLKDKNFNYLSIWGWNGNIVFATTDYVLWLYNCNDNSLTQLERQACRFDVHNEYLFYLSNLKDRFSACQLCCCKLDGTDKRILIHSYEGVIGVKGITDTELKYEFWYGSKKAGTIKWNNKQINF